MRFEVKAIEHARVAKVLWSIKTVADTARA
jgi:hypothetical protein